jgi:hypothetical protein
LGPVGDDFLVGDDDRIQLGDYVLKMLTPSCGYVYAVCIIGAHALAGVESVNRFGSMLT